jgi:hypothetical protein
MLDLVRIAHVDRGSIPPWNGSAAVCHGAELAGIPKDRCECHLRADFFDHIQATLFAAALCSTRAPVNGVESTGISVGSPLSQFA